MKKKSRIGLIVLVVLMLSTVYTYAASGQSTLNTYKQPLSELMTKLEAVIENVKDQSDEQLQKEVTQIKKEREQVINQYVDQEEEQAIAEVDAYQVMLKNQIAKVEGSPAFVELHDYEREKQKEIAEEVNIEITEYLSDMLSNR